MRPTLAKWLHGGACHGLRNLLILLIRGYRYLLSPWVGGQCRFTPSCSCYAEAALRTHGTVRGLNLTIRRLLRCRPGCPGGWDPVPVAFSSFSKVDAP